MAPSGSVPFQGLPSRDLDGVDHPGMPSGVGIALMTDDQTDRLAVRRDGFAAAFEVPSLWASGGGSNVSSFLAVSNPHPSRRFFDIAAIWSYFDPSGSGTSSACKVFMLRRSIIDGIRTTICGINVSRRFEVGHQNWMSSVIVVHAVEGCRTPTGSPNSRDVETVQFPSRSNCRIGRKSSRNLRCCPCNSTTSKRHVPSSWSP